MSSKRDSAGQGPSTRGPDLHRVQCVFPTIASMRNALGPQRVGSLTERREASGRFGRGLEAARDRVEDLFSRETPASPCPRAAGGGS